MDTQDYSLASAELRSVRISAPCRLSCRSGQLLVTISDCHSDFSLNHDEFLDFATGGLLVVESIRGQAEFTLAPPPRVPVSALIAAILSGLGRKLSRRQSFRHLPRRFAGQP